MPEIDVEAYYSRYGPMVYRRCLALLGDEAAAGDAMQEVFIRVLERKRSLQHKAPSSLLFRIATNICLNHIRNNQKVNGVDNHILLDIASTENLERQLFVQSSLERLFADEKASSRTISVMHYIDRMTLEEIAAEVNMSVSGVRRRLRKLREKSQLLREEDD